MGIRFSCINIYAKDPIESFEFYKGLGLTVENEGDPNTDWFGAVFKLLNYEDAPVLCIWRNTDNRDIKNNIVMHCDNIEQTYKELKDKGYSIDKPEMKFYGDKEMKLVDPDGNQILFLS